MYSPVVHLKAARLLLPTNRKGKDFIVGDLHGQYSALMVLLRAAGFSPARGDRLFSVGDLIDRGPESSLCLRLLNRPWFHAVLGNHDFAFAVNLRPEGVDAFTQHYCVQAAVEGGQWYMQHDRRDLMALAAKVNFLPHIITVGDGKVDFHVTHASLLLFAVDRPMALDDESLDIYENSRDQDVLIHSLIGERKLWKKAHPPRAEGLATTYCGHCILSKPKWALSHLNIDTGAAFDSTLLEKRSLTLACHQDHELWSVGIPDTSRIVRCRIPKAQRAR